MEPMSASMPCSVWMSHSNAKPKDQATAAFWMAKTTGKGDTGAYVSPWRGKMTSISMLAGRETWGVAALVAKAASWRTTMTRREGAIVGRKLTWSSSNAPRIASLLSDSLLEYGRYSPLFNYRN